MKESFQVKEKNDLRKLMRLGWFLIALLSHFYVSDVAANEDIDSNVTMKQSNNEGTDTLDDGFLDPVQFDSSCLVDGDDPSSFAEDLDSSCWSPPESTIEEEEIEMFVEVANIYGGSDPSDTCEENSDNDPETCGEKSKAEKKKIKKKVDKHWGADDNTLRMREKLRKMGTKADPHSKRPPIFLLPGLASTRLVAWKPKVCKHKLLSDVKLQEYMWLHVGKLVEMATIDDSCWAECMSLGLNQTDMDDEDVGCKLRPDEGLDAISSLAPNSASSNLLVGGTNTVYAWLVQWLADNLGYDVSSMIGLPYDWRLSPDKMEERDGFLTLMRRRIEAAVISSGSPGILVAHSMGNIILRYFLEWLRHEMRVEAFNRYKKAAARRTHFPTSGWMSGSSSFQQENDEMDTNRKKDSPAGKVKDVANFLKNGFDDIMKTFNDNDNDDKENLSEEKLAELEERVEKRERSLWELAKIEGDTAYLEWLDKHIWTYVGLSAPLLGAINTLRSVISGEKMGMPLSEDSARAVELSFGSTHTISCVSTKLGFCDNDVLVKGTKATDEGFNPTAPNEGDRANLACMEDIVEVIEKNSKSSDPWENFPVLRSLLKDRVDWDTDVPPIKIQKEKCRKGEKAPCAARTSSTYGPLDVQNGRLFKAVAEVWNEEGSPMLVKRDQLEDSWWHSPFPNIMNSTWDRPHIKHIIMAYGVDRTTEIGYTYRKEELINDDEGVMDTKNDEAYDGIPTLHNAIWENENGELTVETFKSSKSLADTVLMKKPKMMPLNGGNTTGSLFHAGDGAVPYLSLSWAHTWLLHASRAIHHSSASYEAYRNYNGEGQFDNENPLDSIKVTHRPEDGNEWIQGVPKSWKEKQAGAKKGENVKKDGDTGTSHPHGTKYKPEMVRFQSEGKSRSTGMIYTTSVIEAVKVEHKETTRNYDILAAAFTDVLNYMHDDLGLV